VKKPPTFRTTETTLAKGIDDRGSHAIPLTPTTFTTEDSQVVSFLTYENLTGIYILRWEWYAPAGRLYTTEFKCYAEGQTAAERLSSCCKYQ